MTTYSCWRCSIAQTEPGYCTSCGARWEPNTQEIEQITQDLVASGEFTICGNQLEDAIERRRIQYARRHYKRKLMRSLIRLTVFATIAVALWFAWKRFK